MITLALALAAALTLGACGEDGAGLTAPDGGVYLEVRAGIGIQVSREYTVRNPPYSYSRVESFGDGGTATPGDLLRIRVQLQGRGGVEVKTPVTVQAIFQFEDGTAYDNQALVYGPYTGYLIEVDLTFRIQDGLLQMAREKPGQRIKIALKFSSGQAINLFGFYIAT
jgi:hypothetical protein